MNISTIWERVKSKLFGKSIFERAKLSSPYITDEMAAAINEWSDLYKNICPWLSKDNHSLGLPSAMAQEMARLVTLEMEAKVVDPANSAEMDDDDEQIKAPELDRETTDETSVAEKETTAQLVARVFKLVLDNIESNVEYACALGGLVFRPYFTGDDIAVDYVHADDFYPEAFNSLGEITAAIFLEHKRDGNRYYTRMERHEIGENTYTVTNKAFVSSSDTDIGNEIPLTDVPEWASIQPEATISNVDFPLFAYFKIPLGNIIDRHSQLGVSIFARAQRAGLLEKADEQWQGLMWEYKGGELAIDASSDMFKPKRIPGSSGKSEVVPVLPQGFERLFRTNDLPIESTEIYKVFNPTLRDQNYANGLNEILMRIEDTSGFARGTFSNLNETQRTATEVIHSKQRSYATVSAIQKSLEKSLDKLGRAVAALASLYDLTTDGDYAITYTWDDSIVVDADTEREKDRMDVSDGLMMPWEYRVKWYKETKEQAQKVLAEGKDSESDDDIMGFVKRNLSEPDAGVTPNA